MPERDRRVPHAVLADADADDPVDLVLILWIATADEDGARRGLAPGQLLLANVSWVLASQPNSGLQMTVEDSPVAIGEVVDALRDIGALDHARLLREAAQLADDAWGELDEQWWELDGPESALAARMWAYVVAHPQQFFRDRD